MKIVYKSIMQADTKYIAHQCNCISQKAAHLAYTMFQDFPYADVYRDRTQRDTPGSIKVRGDGIDKRFVINMFAQYYPGKSKYSNDSEILRLEWFQKCLDEILKIEDLESIAFPEGIGCGAAGGNWDKYKEMIENFARQTTADVVLYSIEKEE